MVVLAVLFVSCKRQDANVRNVELNPQARAYLDSLAAKEKANIEKGWVHIEGTGYHYEKPQAWTESRDMDKGIYFLLTSPGGDVTIQLISRYIQEIPEGVRNLTDLVQLQYSLMGMPEALGAIRNIEVAGGEALEAWIRIGDRHLRARYFMNVFQNPEDQRLWLLLVESGEKSRLDAPDVQKFLDTFRVGSFRWLGEGTAD